MKLFVKRENWDGGIWMKLPASEEQAEQVQKKLAGYHPSRMFPFRGDVEAPVAGLTHLLIGEFVFQDSNLGQLNYLAAKIVSWSEQEREGRTLPVELIGYFDYEAYGRLNMKSSERLTDEGLITRIKELKPAVEKKQNPEVVQSGTAVFRVHLVFDKRYPEKICFYFPMSEKQLEALEEK